MGKILLASDIHVHTHKNSLRRLQHCLDALKWIFETAIERDIKDVVFLGDLFQDREKIQVLCYLRTFEVIQKYTKDLNLYLLVGNHDMWFANKTDVSSIYPLGALENVRIIRNCETININGLDIDFLPFTLNPLKSLEAFSNKNSRVLFGHIALDGAQLNTFYKTQAEVSVEYDGDMVKVDTNQFTPWERVFLGHYHGEQRIGHVEYVGSPLQLNFAEAYQEKHVVILDTDNLSTEYVENTFSPRHLILVEGESIDFNDGNIQTKLDLNNTFVKFMPKDIASADIVDVRNNLIENFNILTLELMSPKAAEDESTKVKVEDAQSILMQDREGMLEEYMKVVGIPDGLDFEKLLNVGKQKCQKSQVE